MTSNDVAIVFVCHNDDSISRVIQHNHFIIMVGDQEINESYRKYPKLIVARELKDNIEYEKKLLTFTAWYAIIKNNLFSEYAYICVLEYDVLFYNSFEENLYHIVNTNREAPNFSFFMDVNCFLFDVNIEVMKEFLQLKNIDPNLLTRIREWGCTTNQCIRRDLLNDFVEWYETSYLFIKERDFKMLPYYHERLYMVYLKSINIETQYTLNLLQHLRMDSHSSYE